VMTAYLSYVERRCIQLYVSDNQMKKILQILIMMVSITCNGSSQNIYSDVQVFEDENLKVSIKHFEEANIIDKNWLSFVFYNKSIDTIIIEDFEYRTEYDTASFENNKGRKNSLGQGNKYDVFPCYTDKDNPSNYDVIILPNKKIEGYRSVSNYASVLLGYDNETNLNIFSKIKIKSKYSIKEKEINIYTESPEINFTWTTQNTSLIADRLIDACDSIHLRGSHWIIGNLMRDTNITSQITEDTYVRLITQRIEDSFSTRRNIISAFVKHYKTNHELNEFYKNQLRNPNPSILQDLNTYWDDTLLDPLVNSFKLNNKNHYQYLKLLDKHHELWKDNTKLKTELYNQIMEYANQVLVKNKNLSNKNKSGWQSWISELKMIHSEEAEQYFKTFFKNKLPLFEEKNNPMKFYSNAPPYYPAVRACDAALEAFIYSKYGDVSDIYIQKFDELVSEGKLKKSSPNKGYLRRNTDLLNKDNMETIRNELIKDYR